MLRPRTYVRPDSHFGVHAVGRSRGTRLVAARSVFGKRQLAELVETSRSRAERKSPNCPPDPTPSRPGELPARSGQPIPAVASGHPPLPPTGDGRNGRKGTTRLERGALVLGALWSADGPRRYRAGAAGRGGRALRRESVAVQCSALTGGRSLVQAAAPRDHVVFAALAGVRTGIFGVHAG